MQKKSFGYWFAASTEYMCKILTATDRHGLTFSHQQQMANVMIRGTTLLKNCRIRYRREMFHSTIN